MVSYENGYIISLMIRKVNKRWYNKANTHTTDKDVAHMPISEVRSLDLGNSKVTATPFPNGSNPITIDELNYVWIYVQNATTQVETSLRFKVINKQLVLRSVHDHVSRIEAELREMSSSSDTEIAWRAIMVNHSIPGVAHIEPSLVMVGDYLEVETFGIRGETLVVPRVILGVVTKIELTTT